MSQVPGRQRQEDSGRGGCALEAKATNQTATPSAAGDLRPGTTATCPAPNCGNTCWLVLTTGGHRILLNPEPHPDGTITIRRLDDGTIRGHILTGDQLPAQDEAWVRHDTTCIDSPHSKRRAYARAPKCRACQLPMDAWLPANGWAYHVNCEPPADMRARVNATREKRTA
jgi:hypothetical protein